MESYCDDCPKREHCDLCDNVNFCECCKYSLECDIRMVCCDFGHDIECNNGFKDIYD